MCFQKIIRDYNDGCGIPTLLKATKDIVVYKTLNHHKERKMFFFTKEVYQSVVQHFEYKKNKVYSTTLSPIIFVADDELDIIIYEGFHSFANIMACYNAIFDIAEFIIPEGAYYMVDNKFNPKYYVSDKIIFKKMISVQERADIVYHEFLNRNNKDNKNK